MSKLMVSVSGVRGIIGEGLAPRVVLEFAQAFATYVEQGKVVVGRDSRVSGDILHSAVSAGLQAVGCDIIDIGVCPTPTTQLVVEKLKANGGIMITASHNPIMWNGLKMLGPDGLFLDAEQGERVLSIAKSGDFPFATYDRIGARHAYAEAVSDHVNAILALDYFDAEKIRRRRFRVVLDCICGAGAVLIPDLLWSLGCEVIEVNCEATGLFPRNPEPLPENLSELCERVKSEKADLGVAVDPDSDRLALVSEKGEPLGEERTLALAVKFMLDRKPGPVVVNASTSRANDDVARAAGVEVIRTKVGEINVAKKMREVGAVIGGEGNGGVILPELHLGRDAPAGIVLTLQHLAEFGGALSELNDTLPNYVITKDKVELENIEPQTALERIREAYANEKLDLIDGVKILFDQSWVHIRPSNTEPIIRVIAEAPTAQDARKLCDEVKSRI